MDISKSYRKRRRRRAVSSDPDETYTPPKKPREVHSNRPKKKTKLDLVEKDGVLAQETSSHISDSIEQGYSAEEVLNSIEENLCDQSADANSTANEDSVTTQIGEIFFAHQIPQCNNNDIIVPFLSDAAASVGTECPPTIITTTSHAGPNVIVEPVPCYLPTMDTFDENELNGLIDLNEQELIDHLLEGGTVEFM